MSRLGRAGFSVRALAQMSPSAVAARFWAGLSLSRTTQDLAERERERERERKDFVEHRA
jgi:hypothetical protein